MTTRNTLKSLVLLATLVSFMGQTGPAGPTGNPGPEGPAGPEGPQGPSPFSLQGNDAVYTQGNLGIGTITPAEPVHVVGDKKVEGTVIAGAFSSRSPLELQTAGTTRIFVDDFTGSVGVGTTNPSAAATLDILGNTHVDGDLRATGDLDVGRWSLQESPFEPGTLFIRDDAGPDQHVFRSDGSVNFFTGAGGEVLVRRNVIADGDIEINGGADTVAGGEEDLRIVRGGVGTGRPGIEYFVTQLAIGRYQVTFFPQFGGTPTVTATAFRTAGGRNYAQIDEIGPTFFTINIYSPNSGGSSVNSEFTFVAVGPQL